MRTRAGRARARSRSSAGEERGVAPDVARASFDGDFSSGWPSEANELRRPTPYPFSVFALDNSFPEETKEEAMHDTMKWLLPHKTHILKDRWHGLPELTNSHGQHCPGSCVTQAWSISTLLDAMRDLYYYMEDERHD